MGICKLCGTRAQGRGLCKQHYDEMLNANRLTEFPTLVKRSLAERLLEKYVITDTGCWVIPNNHNDAGYALIWDKGRAVRAHIASYQLHKGPIPTGKVVRHTCDNRPCIHPDHLILGTRGDNNRDTRNRDRHARGERHGHARLTDAQVLDIFHADGVSQTALAKAYGVSQSVISRIRLGKVWTHVTRE